MLRINWLLSSTIFNIHYLSLSVVDYLLPVIAGKSELFLVLYAVKSKHHLDHVDMTWFHSDEFFRARVTGQSTSGSVRLWLPSPSRTHMHTYAHAHLHMDETV